MAQLMDTLMTEIHELLLAVTPMGSEACMAVIVASTSCISLMVRVCIKTLQMRSRLVSHSWHLHVNQYLQESDKKPSLLNSLVYGKTFWCMALVHRLMLQVEC